MVTRLSPQAPSWSASQPLSSNNWWKSEWMGSFYLDRNTGWIMHHEIGWLFPMPIPQNGVWFWHGSLGWIWTESSLYPFFYLNRDAGWIYFYDSESGRSLFYNYASSKWMAIQASQK